MVSPRGVTSTPRAPSYVKLLQEGYHGLVNYNPSEQQPLLQTDLLKRISIKGYRKRGDTLLTSPNVRALLYLP